MAPWVEWSEPVGPFFRLWVSTQAAGKVPVAVLIRCVRRVIVNRREFPPNSSWQEPAVTDIDGQLVIMVLKVLNDDQGRRCIGIERARYKPKKGR